MHKIKELLHKDNEDTNVNNTTSNTEKHGLFHHGHGNNNTTSRDAELLSNRQFEENHMHHGEIEHGGQQQHIHGGQQWQGGERHIVHEREALRDGGDLGYRAGVDPTMNRSIETATSHSGGESREIIDEGKIVKESIKEVELHKVQPVIHRNREQKEIRHVVEPHQKFEVKDTTIDHREREIDLGVRREASTLETSRSLGSGPNIQSSREFLGTDREHQELPARVEEHVHRKVEEHIHPVIYKEVLQPKVTEETHHIYETVKEAPIETYEVKGIARPRGGDNLMQAEREFINRESSRGMVLGEGHSCSRDLCLGSRTGCSGGRCQYFDNTGNSGWRQSGWTSSERTSEFSGGNQFLGNQHARGMPLHDAHNSAYDAALCNQCTNNAVCSHSARDADRMQKMNEKKIMKDQKLAEKQMHKRERFEDKNRNVNVV